MLSLQMVFLDFFEALLGCAEVYVVETCEQPDVSAIEQQPDITAVVTTEQIATPSVTHSPSLIEQVLLISAICVRGAAKNVLQ